MSKIAIDLRLHAYAPGGISRYARRLAVALGRLLPPDTLTLLPHRQETVPLDLPNTQVYRAWTPPHHWLERWSLSAELLPQRFDLLHTTDFIPPWRGAQRSVITVHDLNFLHYPQYLTADARRYYNHHIEWAVARADAILADSEATRRDLDRLLNVSPERVHVTPLAADACFRPLSDAETHTILTRYQLTPGYLLFVGTWEPRKNLPGLLAALSLLHAQGEKLTLVIAGRPGWLYDDIFERMQQLHLAPWVRFIEEVPLGDLIGLYNGALALTMPSFYEGFGLPALEALQCGIPAIVADRASLPEVVGDAGLLVDPDVPETLAQACATLAQDADLRARLCTLGLEHAQNFTWAATAAATLAVYQKVLAPK